MIPLSTYHPYPQARTALRRQSAICRPRPHAGQQAVHHRSRPAHLPTDFVAFVSFVVSYVETPVLGAKA